jgi:predicted negative regulator of RcsB-dependent stress response
MRCKSARELQAYLDHELALPRREALRRHLQDCACCREELEGLQHVARLLAHVRPLAPPAHLLPATLQRLRTTAPAPPGVALVRRAPGFAAVAAAAAVLIVSLHATVLNSPPSVPVLPAVSAPDIISPAAIILPVMPAALRVASAAPARAARTAGTRRPHLAGSVALAKTPTKSPATSARPAPTPVEARAVAAYQALKRHATEDDPDLMVAALQNVALAYPGTRQGTQALLSAADLQRQRGNLAEADAAYRCVLAQRSSGALSQALAHKALGDLRTQTVGDDAVARHHYQEAARALRTQSARDKARGQAVLVMADIARATGNRAEAVADYATVANQATGEQALACLAEVL